MLDGFASEKDKLTLELVMPIRVKGRDPFVRVWKKIGPTLSLDVSKHTDVKIVEEEALVPIQKNFSSKKGGEKMLRTEPSNNFLTKSEKECQIALHIKLEARAR